MAEAPESVRRTSARALGSLLLALGVLGLGAAVLEISLDADNLDLNLVIVGVLTVLIAIPGGIMEFRRDHRGEVLGALAFVTAFMASALLLVNAYWYYIPFIGAVNLLVMIMLMWRIAVRSETNVEAQKEARTH